MIAIVFVTEEFAVVYDAMAFRPPPELAAMVQLARYAEYVTRVAIGARAVRDHADVSTTW